MGHSQDYGEQSHLLVPTAFAESSYIEKKRKMLDKKRTYEENMVVFTQDGILLGRCLAEGGI